MLKGMMCTVNRIQSYGLIASAIDALGERITIVRCKIGSLMQTYGIPIREFALKP
jgi:hypothetical protein